MAPTEEVAAATEPVADPAPAEEPAEEKPEEEKPAKAKKAKAAKEPKAKNVRPRKPKAAPSHPPYLEMVTEAIVALKERTGSSQIAIAKFIEDKRKSSLQPNFKKMLSIQFKKLAETERMPASANGLKQAAEAEVGVVNEQRKDGEWALPSACLSRSEASWVRLFLINARRSLIANGRPFRRKGEQVGESTAE